MTTNRTTRKILSRESCPVCNKVDLKSLYKRTFSDQLMIDYMTSAYQGNADMDILDGEVFELQKCMACNFIFQKQILSDQLLHDLYN